MSQVGFEYMIPVFEWVRTVHALNCVATVTGCLVIIMAIFPLVHMTASNLSVSIKNGEGKGNVPDFND